MPIKPENKNRYPANWDEISHRIRFVRAKGKCEDCGVPHNAVIKRLSGGVWRLPNGDEWEMIHNRIKHSHSSMSESLKYHGFVKIILTTAHLDHQPENCDDNNLKALCQKCHNQHDAQHRRCTRKTGGLKNQLKLF